LRQVDFNGRESLEGPIGIRVEREIKTSVSVYPNPAKSEVNFEVTTSEISDMEVTMFDVAGKVVVPSFASTKLESGTNKLTIDLADIPAGSYILRIAVGRKAFIKKFSIVE